MTQNGVVTAVLDDNMAEVAILRGTACGGSCGSCEACVYNSKILVKAANPIFARAGERVVLQSDSSSILGVSALIYLLPLLLLFVFYFLAAALSAEQGTCILLAFLGLLVGVGLVVWIGRRKKAIRYEITGYLS